MRVVVGLLVLCLLGACLVAFHHGRTRPPNVILICVDGCRADHLGIYGYGRPTSPNLDRLARQGVYFERNYSQANESLFSHASLFSSRYPSEIAPLNYQDFALPRDLQTLPKVLHQRGYACAAFTGGGHVRKEYGFGDGFDVYKSDRPFGTFYDSVPPALDWIGAHRDRPMFVFLHGYDCHRPYRKPPVFGHLYDPDYKGDADRYLVDNHVLDRVYDGVYYPNFKVGSVVTSQGDHPIDPRSYLALADHAAHAKQDGQPLSAADIGHLLAHYDGAVTYADTWMGTVFASLDRLGLDASNTIIVVIADHGEDLMEHGVFNHRIGLQLSNIHVPFIVWGAGVAAGRHFDMVTQNLDVVPTVLGLLDQAPLQDTRGRDLSALLRGTSEQAAAAAAKLEDRPAFAEGVLDMSTVVTRDYQLIATGARPGTQSMADLLLAHPPESSTAIDFYDLARDRGEHHSVAAEPAVRGELVRMRDVLLAKEGEVIKRNAPPQNPHLTPEQIKSQQDHGYDWNVRP